MEACKELRIDPGDVKIKKTDSGAMLLSMSPNDFESFVPNKGQQLYDYFNIFKTQHYISSGNDYFINSSCLNCFNHHIF